MAAKSHACLPYKYWTRNCPDFGCFLNWGVRILDRCSNLLLFVFQIRDIQEDVDYYIDNCLEPDFTENDMIYDDIDGLEEMLLDVRIFTFLSLFPIYQIYLLLHCIQSQSLS